jgi:hypothetical protein
MIGKKLINTGAAADAVFTPSEHFNTVLYTGNGSTQRIGGYINRGAVFNGSSSFIETSSEATTTEGNKTISGWIFSSVANNGFALVANGKIILQYNANAFVVYKFVNGKTYYSGSVAAGEVKSITTSASYSINTWYHVAIMQTGTGDYDFKLYINGTEPSTTQGSTAFGGYTASNFIIGSGAVYSGTRYSFWNGKIDQVRIFNKELSSTEVTTLYGETHASTTIETTDIFDDDSGVALYQLDGNANDTGGVSGKFGSAAIFNGSSSKIDFPNNPIGTNLVGSVSLWAQGSSLTNTSTNVHMIFYNQNPYISFDIFNGNLRVTVKSSSGSNTTINYATSNFNATDWYHISYVVNGTSSNFELFVNGLSVGTATAPTTTFNVAPAAHLGHGGGYQYFNGKLDDVRIYSDALTSDEVGYLYNNTTASIPTDNLTAYYKLDGDARDEQQLYDGTATNVTYAYDGTASNVTYQEATKFSPDLVWIKTRNQPYDHNIVDSLRGTTKYVRPNRSIAEVTQSDGVTSFDTNGFTVGSGGDFGGSNNEYVAWCFNAGTDAPATNNDGTIASTVKANQDAGFSIVKYTGNGVSNATIGHGLSQAPEFVIIKSTSSAHNWFSYHKDSRVGQSGNPEDGYMLLNTTSNDNPANSPLMFNSVAPSSTVLNLASYTEVNGSGKQFISYCFHSVDGYQKAGSYTGTGAAGNFIETGFEPAFVLAKPSSSTGSWLIMDNKRDADSQLYPNLSSTEYNDSDNYFYSNGFEMKSNGNWNTSGVTFIYLAIAADPDITTPTVENSFDVVAYTGNGGTQSIDTDFKPDLVWIKDRDGADNHHLFDTIRGTNQRIMSNQTSAENTEIDCLNSFDSNGFSIGANSGVNANNEKHVAWVWKAGDHDDNLPQINTEGTIDSVVSVNAEAGFSIVKYTGNGNTANIGHGLSSAPELIIIKNLDSSTNWVVGADAIAWNYSLNLNDSSQKGLSSNRFNATAPTSTVFSVGATSVSNGNNNEHIAYCFHSVTGYQKIGSYTGTGTTGNKQTIGFRPRFLLSKRTSSASDWYMIDSVRNTSNPRNNFLNANTSDAEYTPGYGVNFEDDGFSFISTDLNGTNQTWIYLAIK